MYWINLVLFSGYICFWFRVIDNPLQILIKHSVFAYKNIPIENLTFALRMAFMYFLFNIGTRILSDYISFKNFINKKEDNTTNQEKLQHRLTRQRSLDSTLPLAIELEKDRYKLDFTVDTEPYSIIIQRNTEEYNSIEGIYTDDYKDCVTREVKPFFAFCQDKVYPRDINKIHDREDECFFITYKNKEDSIIF